MKKTLDEEYVNCFHSIVQEEKSTKKWMNTYSLLTQAITSSEKLDDQGKEEYCTFCLIPFLKLIIQLQQLSEKKVKLCIRYTDLMLNEDIDYSKDNSIEDALRGIEKMTQNISLNEWHRHELREALDTLLHHTKNRKNLWDRIVDQRSVWSNSVDESSADESSVSESSLDESSVWVSGNQSNNNTKLIWTNPHIL